MNRQVWKDRVYKYTGGGWGDKLLVKTVKTITWLDQQGKSNKKPHVEISKIWQGLTMGLTNATETKSEGNWRNKTT